MNQDMIAQMVSEIEAARLSCYRAAWQKDQGMLGNNLEVAQAKYLAGEIEEADFLKKTRQGRAYPKSHRPLIEYCKANGIPVIAANAPRPLVSGYRKSDAESYTAYLEGLSEEERAALPRSTTTPDDPYKARFMKFMGPKRGPAFFRSQALWDDAMGEAVADFRDANPEHQVLLIIGGFHVTGRLGTITKFLQRRPDDTVHVTVMDVVANPAAPLTPDQAKSGDALLLVRAPKQPQP